MRGLDKQAISGSGRSAQPSTSSLAFYQKRLTYLRSMMPPRCRDIATYLAVENATKLKTKRISILRTELRMSLERTSSVLSEFGYKMSAMLIWFRDFHPNSNCVDNVTSDDTFSLVGKFNNACRAEQCSTCNGKLWRLDTLICDNQYTYQRHRLLSCFDNLVRGSWLPK